MIYSFPLHSSLERKLIHSLILLLSHFSRVWLCVTPWTAAYQAPPSLGISRQEHWSGLSFPSPMHESEKWKWSRSFISDCQRPYGLQPTRLLCPWDFPGKTTGVGCHCLLRSLILQRSKLRPRAQQAFSSLHNSQSESWLWNQHISLWLMGKKKVHSIVLKH